MIFVEAKRGEITLVNARGKLDATSAPEVDGHISSLIKEGAQQVVLDMSGVEYISSAGLRALLGAAKHMQKAGGRLGLAAPPPHVRKILDLARFSAIVPVFDTAENAFSAFTPIPKEQSPESGLLSVAEEIYLLALDDVRGVLKPLPVSALDYALAGAVLMELALRNRIDSDLSSMRIISADPTGDPLLDDALNKIRRKPDPQPTSFWLEQFADESERIEERVLERLIGKGILKQENKRILWVFAVRRYPVIDDRESKEVRSRLRDLIMGDEIPDPRDAILICLANACRLLDDMFTAKEYKLVRSRITDLSRLDLIGQEMSRAIRSIEQAMNAAMSPDMMM